MKNENKDIKLKEYLAQIGFNDDDIDYILKYTINEIDRDILHEKIKYLIYLGLEARQIRIIIEEDLTFATESLELIKYNGDLLKKYLNEQELICALEVTPELLTVEKGCLEQNINLLKLVIDKEDYLKIIMQDRGEILTYKPDYLSDKFTFFVKNGLKDKILNIIIQNIEIFDLDNDEIDIKSLK